jgi:hypothetical protein
MNWGAAMNQIEEILLEAWIVLYYKNPKDNLLVR